MIWSEFEAFLPELEGILGERFDYSRLKEVARENRVNVESLLVLARGNDPFYVGQPSEITAARWFAELWERFGFTTGVHLRRVHYRIVSDAEVIRLPVTLSYKDELGKRIITDVYQNHERCWTWLKEAGKYARYLGLIDPDAFVDRRAPEAVIFTQWDQWAEPEPSYDAWPGGGLGDYKMPALPELPGLPEELPELPYLAPGGYKGVQQDYQVEVWAEKSTMNDILIPVCKRYNVNLVTGLGELSITAVRLFLRRVAEAERPARILYVSDFDPKGVHMPKSVARKIEFFQRNDGFGDLDIALQPVILTAEQVKAYSLPRIPVKDSERSKAGFEDAYGEGAVELDALQAIYPGELDRIISGEIERYVDLDLRERASEAKSNLSDYLDKLEKNTIDNYSGELADLDRDYKALRDDFELTRAEFAERVKEFQPKIDAYQERLAGIRERANSLHTKVYGDLRAVEVDLGEYPLPEPEIDGDPDNLLYSSDRDYFEQLVAYNARGG